MAVLVAVIVLCCYFGLQVCVLKVACVLPPPHPLPDFYEGEGRWAQATLKVELDCSGDNKPTYSSTATDPVNNSGVALANHCQSVIFYCFCPVHISKE